MRLSLRRREFIAGLGGAAAYRLAGRARQLPTVAFLQRQVGCDDAGYVSQWSQPDWYRLRNQSVTVEFHRRYDQLPSIILPNRWILVWIPARRS
jgi:hypothetical protein